MQDLSGALSKRLHLAQVWPLVAVGLLGLVLAAAAWITVSVWEERLAKARFNDVAGDYQAALQAGLDRYVDEIRAVRALYDASQSVDFRESSQAKFSAATGARAMHELIIQIQSSESDGARWWQAVNE
jgi:CHASE1-domain containing sensor protein